MILSLLHEQLVARATFPLSQYLYNRRGIGRDFQQSRAIDVMPPEETTALQLGKLQSVINHAAKYVPYYSRMFNRVGIRPGDIRCLDDLRAVPALTRDDVIANKRDLIDRRYLPSADLADRSMRGPAVPMPFARFRKFPLIRNTSSGSTGTPTVFYEDGSVSARSWANELRVKRWFGLQQGVSEARLVRISPDFVERDRMNHIRRLLWNQLVLPGVNLTNKEYGFIVDQLGQFNPKAIWAFTSAAAGVARYMVESGRTLPKDSIKLIITWAAPLYEHERDVIQRAFGCAVGNIYGMREVGHIGACCPTGSLHVFQEGHLLEKDANGELLVTFLRPSPMPFIRYRTGDLGELTNDKCACGRTLQTISHFYGRTGEVFTTADGRMFSPNFWCRTFMDARLAAMVQRFQIIYAKNQTIKIRMILPEGNRPVAQTLLYEVVKKNFGPDTTVQFDYPAEIAPQISGKYQMVINETKP